ncbi:MAG: zinc-binding dehydrogenase [Nitrospiraceae bacterium]
MKAIYFDKDIPKELATKALKRIWPRVVWTPIAPTGVEESPDPELPGPRWLRVRNRQCGVCATDLTFFFVNGDPRIAPLALPGLDRVYLGHEAVGEVVEVGSEVERFRVGDRVVIEARPGGSPNCHTQAIEPPCEFCARGDTQLCENGSLGIGPVGVGSGWADSYTAHETEVWPVPDDITDDQASLIEPMAIAVHAVLRRVPEPGDRVLVMGAGIIGLLVLQALKALAPKVHITSLVRYSHQGETAERLGADEVISDSGDIYAKAAKITRAKYYQATLNRGMLLGGYDLIYDCVSDKYTMRDSLRLAKAGGTVVVIGISGDTLKFDHSPIWFQQVNLIGSRGFGMETIDGRRLHTFDLVIELLQEGALSDEGLITHRIPFADYKKAISTAVDKRTGAIKVTLTF